jgi:uncharacterized protein YjbI with pentapeptide repeats
MGKSKKNNHPTELSRIPLPKEKILLDEKPIEGAANIVAVALQTATKELLKPQTKFGIFVKSLAIIVPVISLLFAYIQYVGQTIEARIQQSEQILQLATSQLTSSSEAVRVGALRQIYELAFKEFLTPPEPGILGLPKNAYNWITGNSTRRYLTRCRQLYSEYAKTRREFSQNHKDIVSTEIVLIAIQWINKEVELYSTNRMSPEYWFLYGISVSKAYIPGTNLSESFLVGTDFSLSNLSGCSFENSKLTSAILEGASLENSNLNSAVLINARMSNTILNYSQLNSANLSHAILTDAELTLARAKNCNFKGAVLRRTKFRSTDLGYSEFNGANLTGAIFTNADLTGCNFENTILDSVDFRGAIGLDKIISWDGSNRDKAFFDKKKHISKILKEN